MTSKQHEEIFHNLKIYFILKVQTTPQSSATAAAGKSTVQRVQKLAFFAVHIAPFND